ncbi:hypothetical protein DBR42_00630 [Pelomonas sp. HMWF004]|nr:hypothetical protein DBR42_00630 [Pelomonas sp. HMWF004]
MPSPRDFDELVKLFRLIGMRDPESWARSQATEGINQLHRALFLRQAWAAVVSDTDDSWMDIELGNAQEGAEHPFAGIGLALERLLSSGADRRDLNDLVRGMQARLLSRLCYLLEDPSADEPELQTLGWCLVETDDDEEPTCKSIGGLHESVLDMDPTGREMRPRTE